MLQVWVENTNFASINRDAMMSKPLNKPFGEAPLLPLTVSMMVGIVAGRFSPLPFPLWPLLAVVVLLALSLRRWPMWQSGAIVVCFLVLGALLIQHDSASLPHEGERSRIEQSRQWFLQQRARLLERLQEQGLDGDAYAVVAAMALGDKSELTKELRDTYAITGASHVLALSGLHLSIIYTLLSLMAFRRRGHVFSQFIIVLAIWAFVFLVGMSVSVVRSAIMLSVYALLSLGHRDKMSVNTLAFTAMVMLAFAPSSLFDVGFQLSFTSVFFIILCLPFIDGPWPYDAPLTNPVAKWGWSMIVVSCAAQLGSAPLVAYYFGRFSPWFLPVSFIVIPAATLILWLSLLVLLVPAFSPVLVWVATMLNHILSRIASVPGASISGLHPSLLQIAMVYVIILAVYLIIFLRKGWWS